ncbi:cation diffusion facilitator family transporter [Dolichospermum sp. ST_sed3]|nr:cation diffusion facilitator family transporter [Dolichospermum sp. ST_sed3]
MTAAEKNIQIQRIVVVVAVSLLIIKFLAYLLTHSVAILTDALESIVNVVAGILGLYSLIVSARPRDEDHPYGHGKVEFISSAVEGTLIVIAAILIFYESINSLLHPRELHKIDYGLILIASTAIGNYLMGVWCVRVGRDHNSYALIASGKHLQTDTYSTLGIIAGLIAIYFFKIIWLDSAMAIFFGVVILYNGYMIVRQSIAGIMDETDQELLTKMVSLLNQNRKENWIDLHNVRIIKYGPVLHLDAHITIPWYLNVHEAHSEIDALAVLVRKEFGDSLELYVHSDGCLDFSCPVCQKKDCMQRKHPFQKKIDN